MWAFLIFYICDSFGVPPIKYCLQKDAIFKVDVFSSDLLSYITGVIANKYVMTKLFYNCRKQMVSEMKILKVT